MQKRYVVIAIGLVAVLAVVVLAAAFVRPDDYHNVAVEELKNRASEIEARYHQQRTKNIPVPETDVASTPIETTETVSPSEDSIEAYNKFSEKQIVIDAKQTLELLFENDEDKSEQEFEEELATFCANNQVFIVELRNIAATGGPFRELDFSKGSKMELMPHLQDIRLWVRILAKNGAMAAANGDYETATQDALAIAGFAEGVGKEPVLISQILRTALDNRLYGLISDNVQGENLSPTQATRIIEYSSQFNGRNDLADTLALESTWMITEVFDEVRSGRGERANSFLMRLYGSIGRPLLNRDEEVYVDFMEQLSDAVLLPYNEAQPILEQISRGSQDISFIHLISRPQLGILLPVYTNLPHVCARQEAELGLMQIGLTVEQYHAQHGKYPQNLEEIAPAFSNTLPLDPYTGRDFVYEPHRERFTLYSASGSTMTPNSSYYERGTDNNGNIVWRHTRE